MSVKIKNLSKSFCSDHGQNIDVIKNLNLNTEQNEFTVIIGPTGCGKTTLLNIISGLDNDFSGSVILSSVKKASDISYVFQHYTLFPWRTVIENTMFGMEMNNVEKKERRSKATQLLEEVGLSEYLNHFPHELSGGMRQRVAIAQALSIEPKLIIMDEPFSALDEGTRRDIQAMFVKVWEKNRFSVIFVTHSIEEAVLLADKIIILPSKLQKESKIIDIPFDRPRNLLSKEFDKQFIQIRHLIS